MTFWGYGLYSPEYKNCHEKEYKPMPVNNLRDLVSKETLARLESKMPSEEVDKMLLSIAETILAKGQSLGNNKVSRKTRKV